LSWDYIGWEVYTSKERTAHEAQVHFAKRYEPKICGRERFINAPQEVQTGVKPRMTTIKTLTNTKSTKTWTSMRNRKYRQT
jgi:hypothetical protein